jgi:selenocysteine lyase/cysteine desulfurase
MGSIAVEEASAVARWRAETPGCEARIHLNNAGAALAPSCVVEAVRAHLARESEIGAYEAAEEAAERVADVYQAIGALIGAPDRNVAVVENATAGMALALSSFDLRAGDRIVTSLTDYPSNQIMYMALGERLGVETVVAADRPEGGVDPESVRALLRDPRCRLVGLTWVPTNSGLVQAAYEVGEVCSEAGVPYVVDACQCVGQMPIDVGRLRCDFLTASARKFMRGPRGIGFLYVSDAALDRGAHPLFPDMRGASWTAPRAFRLASGAQRFENWEFSYALLLGMGAAARYSAAVGEAGMSRAWRLAAELRERLAPLPGTRVLDRGSERCAIVSLAVQGRDAGELKLRLRERGINTSAANREHGLLDMDAKHAETALRISPHYYNSEQELDAVVEALGELVGDRT